MCSQLRMTWILTVYLVTAPYIQVYIPFPGMVGRVDVGYLRQRRAWILCQRMEEDAVHQSPGILKKITPINSNARKIGKVHAPTKLLQRRQQQLLRLGLSMRVGPASCVLFPSFAITGFDRNSTPVSLNVKAGKMVERSGRTC